MANGVTEDSMMGFIKEQINEYTGGHQGSLPDVIAGPGSPIDTNNPTIAGIRDSAFPEITSTRHNDVRDNVNDVRNQMAYNLDRTTMPPVSTRVDTSIANRDLGGLNNNPPKRTIPKISAQSFSKHVANVANEVYEEAYTSFKNANRGKLPPLPWENLPGDADVSRTRDNNLGIQNYSSGGVNTPIETRDSIVNNAVSKGLNTLQMIANSINSAVSPTTSPEEAASIGAQAGRAAGAMGAPSLYSKKINEQFGF